MTKYAILFKTHFWDDFVARQLQRLRQVAGAADIFVVIDETIHAVETPGHFAEIRVSHADLDQLRLPLITTHGSVIWYNIDYPHYVAYKNIGAYDYYICLEYDALVTVQTDDLLAEMAIRDIDYLGLPVRKSCRNWPWYEMHRDLYGEAFLVYLSCISVFSHRALALLLRRRQEMAVAFASGDIPFWPNNEAFIPNEIFRAKFNLASLEEFGDVSAYDWWPPHHESLLSSLPVQGFVHPVLSGIRYARSVVYHEPSLFSYFVRGSPFRHRLQNIAIAEQIELVGQEYVRRTGAFLGRKFERLGLNKRWYEAATTGARRPLQSPSAHNRGG